MTYIFAQFILLISVECVKFFQYFFRFENFNLKFQIFQLTFLAISFKVKSAVLSSEINGFS